MGKYFPKLTQTHVWIETDDKGNGFNCPMLPVSSLVELDACTEAMKQIKDIKELGAIRQRMIELAKTVLPEEYCINLERFDFLKLSELLSYLMYGDDDDQAKSKPEKN